MRGGNLSKRMQVPVPATATPGVVSTTPTEIKSIDLSPGVYELRTDGLVVFDDKSPNGPDAFTLFALDTPLELAWPGGKLFVANLTGSQCRLWVVPRSEVGR